MTNAKHARTSRGGSTHLVTAPGEEKNNLQLGEFKAKILLLFLLYTHENDHHRNGQQSQSRLSIRSKVNSEEIWLCSDPCCMEEALHPLLLLLLTCLPLWVTDERMVRSVLKPMAMSSRCAAKKKLL